MADSAYAKKSVTFKFDDDSTRKVTVGNFDPNSIEEGTVADFKTKILAFNSSDVSKVRAAYFGNPDDNGICHPVKAITAADIVTTQKTVVYAKTESARLNAINATVKEGEE